VSSRAEEILATLEEPRENGAAEAAHKLPTSRRRKAKKGDFQLTLFELVDHPLLDEIRELDVNGLTPLAALEKLSQWSAQLKERAQ
jgi:DNA mismatch repair protein MutS